MRHRELSPTQAVHVHVRCSDQGRVDRCWGFFSCLHALKHSQTAWKHKQDVILSPLQGRIQDIVPTEHNEAVLRLVPNCVQYTDAHSHTVVDKQPNDV